MNQRRPGFFCIDNSFFKQYSSTMGPYGYMVYSSLLSYADETGECFPKQSTIAKATGISERKVRDSLLHLENEGFIRSEYRGNGRSNVYYIVPESELDRHNMPESNGNDGEQPAQYAAQPEITEAPHAGQDATPAPHADSTGTACRSQPAQRASPIKEQDPIKQNPCEQDLSFSRNGYQPPPDELRAQCRSAFDSLLVELVPRRIPGQVYHADRLTYGYSKLDGDQLTIGILVTESDYVDWIRNQMGRDIRDRLRIILGRPVTVEFSEE